MMKKMSLLSIVANKELIVKKIKELDNMQFESTSSLGSYVITECLRSQYKMMRNVLNKNMLAKRNLNISNPEIHELFDTLYQHIYMHNFTALTDEIYEVDDAIENYYKALVGMPDKEKLLNSELLICEEIIDMFHFILEYNALLEEHYQIVLLPQLKHFPMDYLYIGDSEFSNKVYEMINSEGSHVLSYLVDREYIDLENIESDSNLDEIHTIMKLNRNFIRKCNFKDWKKYPKDFYDTCKFTELFEINRTMYASCFQMLKIWMHSLEELVQSVDPTITLTDTNMKDFFRILYGVYMAKNAENIRRQNNDPRYTGQSDGEIVGVEV